LDVSSEDELLDLVFALRSRVGYFKIGLELISSIGGPRALRLIRTFVFGGQVFCDSKLHDVPATVGRAAAALAAQRVEMFNVHAAAGPTALKAAAENKGRSRLLAVTVPTSFDDHECQRTYGCDVEQLAYRWALDAAATGCDGLVCSPADLTRFAGHPALDKLIKVTPGIRPWSVPGDDQKRSMTPFEAVRAGADYLVIGRPITRPPPSVGSPAEAAKRIAEEIEDALLSTVGR
jgi:orotidine-5'-phosphate decarboxylase